MRTKRISVTLMAAACIAATVHAAGMPTADDPAIASSVLPKSKTADYEAENVVDGDQKTAWAEGVDGNGIGEWIAVYLGDIATLGKVGEVEIVVESGYQKSYSAFEDNGAPTHVRLELYCDDKVVAQDKVDVKRHRFNGHAFASLSLPKSGTLWLRTTLLEVRPGKKWEDACITETLATLKGADPHGAKAAAKRFAEAVEKKDAKVLKEFTATPVSEVVADFVHYLDDSNTPSCNGVALVRSETVFDLYGTESGDGGIVYVRFEYDGSKWWRIRSSCYSAM